MGGDEGRDTRRARRDRRRTWALALWLLAGLLAPGWSPAAREVRAADNPVVVENRQPGTDEWKLDAPGMRVADDVNKQIKGYASATSVNKGEALTFRITVNPAPQTYSVKVFRMGWYGGTGGRLMATLGPVTGISQPACPADPATGLIACAWAAGPTLTVPANWTSGIYLALLTNASNYQNYVPFVVRDDGRMADFLYQQPVTTYQAYNNYPNDRVVAGAAASSSADPPAAHTRVEREQAAAAEQVVSEGTGKSLYDYNSYGATVGASGTKRAVKVSFDRPYANLGAGDFLSGNFRDYYGPVYEPYFIRWLERMGYDVAYSTNLDTHAAGARLLDHRAFLSVGHDEYWSKEMYDAAEAARDAGVSLAFFGANDVYWQVRFEPSASGVPDRTMVCYKAATADPAYPGPTTTVQFRQAPVGRAEQGLLGVQFTSQNTDGGDSPQPPYVVANSGHWAYAGTGFRDGDQVAGIAGYEVDRRQAGVREPIHRPGTYTLLADSPVVEPNGRTDRHQAAIYQAPSGAWVFAAGTMSWPWALDRPGNSGHPASYVDARLQRATANLLDRFIAGDPSPSPSPSPSASPAAAQACASGFADVPADHPACAAIAALSAEGVLRGYATTPPTFGPGDAVQRAQLAAFLVRGLAWQNRPTGPRTFTDFGQLVGELRTASLILANACEGNSCVAQGYGNGRFGPNDQVTHAQVISFVARAFQLDPAYDWQPTAAAHPYAGVPAVHAPDVRSYHANAGTIPAAPDTAAAWNSPAPREWVARVLYQALQTQP